MAATRFPEAWTWLMDDTLPDWVKRKYSPRESWKDKPFDKPDAQFFFKGIQELSELFTEERPREMPLYFNHPKFRSAYLLYFVPLQAAKFTSIFQLHPKALEAMLEHGRKQGVIRVLDLGSGPGTASIALLLWLLDRKLAPGEELPPIEFDWYDVNRGVIEDGRELAELLANGFSRLRGKVTIRLHVSQWSEATRNLTNEPSLVLLGNVLNEAAAILPGERHEQQGTHPALRSLMELCKRVRGGGLLMVEPAFKKPSQLVSQLRDHLLETGALESTPQVFWGPCPHGGRCPLATGRDWCHFSIPADIPGRWFKAFSRGLGSERQWVKFSYVWTTGQEARAPLPDPKLRLVVSDPINAGSGARIVLLCEPEHPRRLTIPPHAKLLRGDWIDPDQPFVAVRVGGKPTVKRKAGSQRGPAQRAPRDRSRRPR